MRGGGRRRQVALNDLNPREGEQLDLRKYRLSPAQIEEGVARLSYQPFVLSDDICTGAAHSWVSTDDGGRSQNAPNFVLDRKTCDGRLWERFWDANRRLASMYDDFVDAIVQHVPGGTMLDVACNNGYFLIRGAERGMSRCVGYDLFDYSKAVGFLNSVVGTKAQFVHAAYDSSKHEIAGCEQYDVVVASNIMQHISDPLNFLSFLGSRAQGAVSLHWDGGHRPVPGLLLEAQPVLQGPQIPAGFRQRRRPFEGPALGKLQATRL